MGKLKNVAWRARDFFRRDAVLTIACALAALSCAAVPPDAQYASYIDWRTLCLLFSLMVATSGLASAGVLARMCRALVRACKGGGALIAVLVGATFFLSMAVTNDVALVAFVPLALAALREAGLVRRLAFAVVCMTIAANVGSMLTPIGNPQNIYLLNASGMSAGELMALMAPYSVAAFAFIACALALSEVRDRRKFARVAPRAEGANADLSSGRLKARDIMPWAVLIGICLLAVARVIPAGATVVAAGAVALAFDKRAVRHVDYALLLTFVAFFVFVGNVSRIEEVRQAMAALVDGRALLVGAVASQLISNVPAAILLSGFTSDWAALLVGVNIGGLGTLVASMASLISYKQLAVAYPELKGYYVRMFLGMNFAFLAALLVLASVIS